MTRACFNWSSIIREEPSVEDIQLKYQLMLDILYPTLSGEKRVFCLTLFAQHLDGYVCTARTILSLTGSSFCMRIIFFIIFPSSYFLFCFDSSVRITWSVISQIKDYAHWVSEYNTKESRKTKKKIQKISKRDDEDTAHKVHNSRKRETCCMWLRLEHENWIEWRRCACLNSHIRC